MSLRELAEAAYQERKKLADLRESNNENNKVMAGLDCLFNVLGMEIDVSYAQYTGIFSETFLMVDEFVIEIRLRRIRDGKPNEAPTTTRYCCLIHRHAGSKEFEDLRTLHKAIEWLDGCE